MLSSPTENSLFIKLEILDIYQGEKYPQVAINYFDLDHVLDIDADVHPVRTLQTRSYCQYDVKENNYRRSTNYDDPDPIIATDQTDSPTPPPIRSPKTPYKPSTKLETINIIAGIIATIIPLVALIVFIKNHNKAKNNNDDQSHSQPNNKFRDRFKAFLAKFQK